MRSDPRPVVCPVNSGLLETHPDVGLCGQVVDLIGPDLRQQAVQPRTVQEIAVMEEQPRAFDVGST